MSKWHIGGHYRVHLYSVFRQIILVPFTHRFSTVLYFKRNYINYGVIATKLMNYAQPRTYGFITMIFGMGTLKLPRNIQFYIFQKEFTCQLYFVNNKRRKISYVFKDMSQVTYYSACKFEISKSVQHLYH